MQSNGIVGSGQPDAITIADAQAAGALLAWQTNEWELQTGGAACGGTREIPVACDETTFKDMLVAGIFPDSSSGTPTDKAQSGTTPLKAQYLELFAPNILAFPKAVLHAHNLLLQGGNPTAAPTPTAVTTPTPTPAPK